MGGIGERELDRYSCNHGQRGGGSPEHLPTIALADPLGPKYADQRHSFWGAVGKEKSIFSHRNLGKIANFWWKTRGIIGETQVKIGEYRSSPSTVVETRETCPPVFPRLREAATL
jgi:hypothetical protein